MPGAVRGDRCRRHGACSQGRNAVRTPIDGQGSPGFPESLVSGGPGRLVGGLSLRGEEPSMLAEAHRVLRRITHRHHPGGQDELIGRLPSMGQRRRWARAVYRLLEEVSRCQPWWQSPHPYWDFPPLTRREVVWACRAAVLAIAGALGG